MKKLLFIVIFGLVAFASHAQENIDPIHLTLDFNNYGIDGSSSQEEIDVKSLEILNDLQDQYRDALAVENLDPMGKYKVTITLTGCGNTVTLNFNDNFTWSEILQVSVNTLYELCHPCDP